LKHISENYIEHVKSVFPLESEQGT